MREKRNEVCIKVENGYTTCRAQHKMKSQVSLLKICEEFQDRALNEVRALPRLGSCVTAQVTYSWSQPRKAKLTHQRPGRKGTYETTANSWAENTMI